ncbi:MAG: malate synthase A [Sphingomonas bacterium]|nr:malate synthase A [Sphingomonas bacterium]
MSETLLDERTVEAAPSNHPRAGEILTPAALGLLGEIHRRFDQRRRDLLAARKGVQARYDSGDLPDFRADTAAIRTGDWQVARAPDDLQDRRVEITGPTTRKMVINALNSGAKTFMADFEDSTAPTWDNLIDGQANLIDRWRGTLAFTDSASGKFYALGPTPAVLIVRPRGLHLDERHLTLDGAPLAGAFVDFALYLLHNAAAARAAGSGAYYYLPKLESAEEAALWSDVIAFAEERLGLRHGSTRVTVLIETIDAAFQMDEILHALKDHIVGLNCGRWDYIFSTIKRIGRHRDRLTPDRSAMTMDKAFLAAYSLRLIDTCHRRGAHAMGGMAAQIPVKDDAAANHAALAKVRADKEREVGNGHDGTWVAHPALVAVAMEAFAAMSGPNQLGRRVADVPERAAMLEIHPGVRTEAGARENIRVAIQYIAAWLGGRGAVPLYNLMEDAATAEICRSQLWQWLRFEARLDDGRLFCFDLFEDLLQAELGKLPPGPDLQTAARLFYHLVTDREFEEFLTLPAYSLLD